jgi:hypothetical protein
MVAKKDYFLVVVMAEQSVDMKVEWSESMKAILMVDLTVLTMVSKWDCKLLA